MSARRDTGGDAAAVGDDDSAQADLPIVPHPHKCVPRRPARWIRRATRRDAAAIPRSAREGWRDPRLRTLADGGQMRIEMTYRKAMMTSADFSPTIGRDVYAEGAFEGIYRSILTTDHQTAEFGFQIGEISWTTEDGEPRRYTADGGRVTVDGREIWFEQKAHATYFRDPDVADLLSQVEPVLAAHDIEFERIDGTALLEPVRLRTVLDVLRHRNAPFDPRRDVEAAREIIERLGGTAPLGLVEEALRPTRHQARATACSMLIRRAIGFPVDTPLTADTPVKAFRRPNRRLTRTS